MSNTLQKLVNEEPWRRNIGAPKNALDHSWFPSARDIPCKGSITFEGTSRWWVCSDCGYVGSSYVQHHHKTQHPVTFFMNGVVAYFTKKAASGTNLQTVVHQMLYLAGVALQHAAAAPPLDQYAEKIVTH